MTTDAYGGHGGIALYNRDLARALASMSQVDEVVVVPRTMPHDPCEIPDKVRFIADAAGGKLRYVRAALAATAGRFDLVICGHINLLPLVSMLNLRRGAPLVLMGYGIDVWTSPSAWVRGWLRSVDAIWVISDFTRRRMNGWARLSDSMYVLLPNAIHLERFGPAEKRADLQTRFGLTGRKVLMTLARLSSLERYKGIDEVLEALPSLLGQEPTLMYLVAGSGDDRTRLEAKARSLGIEQHVVFAGFVEEAEKADHYRLADVFVMPGHGEGFGFVFLEALACGVPVVGSLLDGSREALLDGELGELVDPRDPQSVREAILRALDKPKGVPPRLEYFAWPRFRDRIEAAVNSLTANMRKAA